MVRLVSRWATRKIFILWWSPIRLARFEDALEPNESRPRFQCFAVTWVEGWSGTLVPWMNDRPILEIALGKSVVTKVERQCYVLGWKYSERHILHLSSLKKSLLHCHDSRLRNSTVRVRVPHPPESETFRALMRRRCSDARILHLSTMKR